MIFVPTPIQGSFVIRPERHVDERGYFARTWCRRELERMGLDAELVQCSVSRNLRNRTLRGMHWQASPFGEVKVIRCTRGAIWDAIIDLRTDSPTYMRHFGIELTEESGEELYVPAGVAHGFVTLRDDTEVCYQMSNYYEASAARGVRWNDPAFGISWPVEKPIIHPRDASYPDYVADVALVAK